MNVVDLHPEELFDKEEAGTLTEAERARLDTHVARCETCRLERRLRADFAAELGDEAEESQFPSNYLVAIVAGAQRSEDAEAAKPAAKTEPEPTSEPTSEDAPAPAPLRRPAPRRRTRWVVLLAAAAVAVVSVAAASETSGGRWIRRVVGVEATENEVETPTGRTSAKATPAEVAPPASAVAKPLASETEPAPAVEEIPAAAPSALAVAAAPVAKAASAPAPVAAPRASAADSRWAPAEPEGASALLEEATLARRRGDYARAVTLARRLQASFPDSREAHVSQATLGRLLLDTGDPSGALASFDAYLAKRGGQLDEAVMVGRGIALDRLGRDSEARAAWAALLEAFPASPYAEHARARGR